MKRTGKWFLSVFGKAVVIALVVVMLPYAAPLIRGILPNVTGEIRKQCDILEQKLSSSKRLEVTTVNEEGVLKADTSVIILGTVGTTTIRYRYTASVGIDLSKVLMITDTDRIIFSVPEPEVLNDGIEALAVDRKNLFSKAVDKSVETLLNEQRVKCREQYLKENAHLDTTWNNTVRAFEETICRWLDIDGDSSLRFEFRRLDEDAAVS